MQNKNEEELIQEDEPVTEKKAKKRKSKKIKKKTLKKIGVVIVLIAVLAVVLYFAFKTLAPQRVIAEINEEKITKQELDQKYSKLPDSYKLFLTKDAFLDQMINVRLLLQEAKKQEISVTDEEIEAEVETIKRQVPTEEAFDQLLQQNNINLQELKDQLREQLAINKLLNKTVISKIEISDSKIKEYYDSHKDDFKAKEGEIRVRHILVAKEEDAKQLLKEIQSGKDFAELAKLASIDTASAKIGGDLGFIQKGQMVKEFEDAAFSLKVGQLSSIVKTQFGYHLIKRESGIITYQEAKEQIREMLAGDLSSSAINIYINQLKSEAVITKNGVKVTTKVETFTKTEDDICREGGKLVIRLFSTTKNPASEWVSKAFDEVANEYKDTVIAYHWQLDTGDNTLTEINENGMPKEEVGIFQKYSPQNSVPAYVFGCKYVRIGNAYSTLDEEKAEFRRVIEQLVV